MSRSGGVPPALTKPGRSCPPESALGGVAPREPTASIASIESAGSSTTAAPAGTEKGVPHERRRN